MIYSTWDVAVIIQNDEHHIVQLVAQAVCGFLVLIRNTKI